LFGLKNFSCVLHAYTKSSIGQVGTKFVFEKSESVAIPLGFGLGSLNATATASLFPVTDFLFGASFTLFLLDSNHAIDITPTASREKSCARGIDISAGQTCEQAIYMPAGIDQISSQLAVVADSPNADAWVAEDHQGYVLRFDEGNRSVEFDESTDCRLYETERLSTNLGAILLCVRNSAANVLEARECDLSLPAQPR
jgi:hypothetical protein